MPKLFKRDKRRLQRRMRDIQRRYGCEPEPAYLPSYGLPRMPYGMPVIDNAATLPTPERYRIDTTTGILTRC